MQQRGEFVPDEPAPDSLQLIAPQELAEYIADMCATMRRLAERQGFAVLAESLAISAALANEAGKRAMH